METIELKKVSEECWEVYHIHGTQRLGTVCLAFQPWQGETIPTLHIEGVDDGAIPHVMRQCLSTLYDTLGQNDVSYLSTNALDRQWFDEVEEKDGWYRYRMYYVSIALQEHVLATAVIPWDYDIYAINVENVDVGRLVYRHGRDDELRYCGHVGYDIEPAHRGHRYSQAALQVLMKQLKGTKTHLILTCDKDNIASKKIIESLQPVSHCQTVVQDGEYEILEIYEVTL